MGWERRRSKLVYYRKVRGADGKPRSIYCGSGERGEQAAREDRERRAAAASANTSPDEVVLDACATPESACVTGKKAVENTPIVAGEDDRWAKFMGRKPGVPRGSRRW
jgi:hypothetical protein